MNMSHQPAAPAATSRLNEIASKPKRQRIRPLIEQIKIQLQAKPFRAFVVEIQRGQLTPRFPAHSAPRANR
jgi:hypothetical protein